MAAPSSAPILVFDSGIGGLTVLREARVLLPERQFVYIADDKAFPYGSWQENDLEAHIVALMAKMIKRFKPEIVIIACNTASTLVLGRLRSHFQGVKFVGTVPAIKPAAERTQSGLVSVLATPGTVKRAYTRDLIQSFASKCHVRLVGSEELAGFAEAYMSGKNIEDAQLMPIIEQCVIKRDGVQTDIVVLACTHYPFLVNRFRQISPWPVDWLDPAEAIARHALSLMDKSSQVEEAPHRDLAYFTSGQASFEKSQLVRGFGLEMIASD